MRYRIVQFTTDPFFGTRIPIAILVEENGEIQLIAIGTGIDASDDRQRVIDLVLEDLSNWQDFDRLPVSVGSLVSIGEPKHGPLTLV